MRGERGGISNAWGAGGISNAWGAGGLSNGGGGGVSNTSYFFGYCVYF